MFASRLAAGSAVVLILAAPGARAEEAWTASGFEAPESVVYDSARDILYVSNIVGAPDGKEQELLELGKGSADLEYIPDQKLAIIPMMSDGVVVAHRID